MLVVMEHRDLHRLLQRLFDVETFRSLDILQVDPAKRRLKDLARTDDFVRVMRIQLEIEHIDIGKSLEEDAFAFHHRLAGQSSNVAQPKNRSSIADYRDQV